MRLEDTEHDTVNSVDCNAAIVYLIYCLPCSPLDIGVKATRLGHHFIFNPFLN